MLELKQDMINTLAAGHLHKTKILDIADYNNGCLF